MDSFTAGGRKRDPDERVVAAHCYSMCFLSIFYFNFLREIRHTHEENVEFLRLWR